MTSLDSFTPPGRALIVGAALVILIAGVQAAATVVAPVLLALFIAVVATPALRWLQCHGWPKWIALLVVAFVLLDVGSLLALLATGALDGFRDSLPTYQERLVLLSAQLGEWLESMGVASRDAVPTMFDPAEAIAVVRRLASGVGGLFASGALILLTVVFMLLEASTLRAKLRVAFHLDEASDARFQQVFDAVNRYMLIKTLTSLGTAAAVYAWLRFLGIDFAGLWGLFAFFLNFVPFVGSVLMAIPAILLALVQTDLQTTLLVALGYLVINTAIGSVLEPRIMGRGLGLSTLAVFLSLLFWGLVLGSVGVFLSVPLTMTLKVALESSPYTRPLAVLLGPEIKDVAEEPADSGPFIPGPAPLSEAGAMSEKEQAHGS